MRSNGNSSKNRCCRKDVKRVSITHKDVRDFAVDLVLPLLGFKFAGRFTLEIIAMILVVASSYRIAVNQAVKKVKKSPPGGVIRHHLRKNSRYRTIRKQGQCCSPEVCMFYSFSNTVRICRRFGSYSISR